MAEQATSRYPMMCRWHKEHNDTCNVCLAWDKSFREWKDSVVTPPQHHPVVTLIKTETWLSQVFNQEKET